MVGAGIVARSSGGDDLRGFAVNEPGEEMLDKTEQNGVGEHRSAIERLQGRNDTGVGNEDTHQGGSSPRGGDRICCRREPAQYLEA